MPLENHNFIFYDCIQYAGKESTGSKYFKTKKAHTNKLIQTTKGFKPYHTIPFL